MPEDIEKEIENREKESIIDERIKKLEEAIEEFRQHRHLGIDESREFSGETKINAKEITIHGAGERIQDFMIAPFNIFDGGGIDKPRRVVATGIYIVGDKEETSEQINAIFAAGKILEIEEAKEIVPSNRVDFNKVNHIQLFLVQVPQSQGGASGPSTFPPHGFLRAYRTPVVIGTGTITIGGDTLTDSLAKFQINKLAGSILILSNLETYKIVNNTENVITIDGGWESASGSYGYEIVTPIFLGAANAPFTRLYVGDDIRLGYGASGGTQVRYIKWGSGSPEGVVIANIGSIFLRIDGSTSTTLYVKTANNGLSTGWTAK